jgi:ABC-type branched-subunit amino acid transport system ATPase component
LPHVAGIQLNAQNISLRFGGLTALDQIGLTIEPGRVHGLIGPNGAGKTSLLNVMSGSYVPDRGDIRIGGTHLDVVGAHAFSRRGVSRTYQTMRLFDTMSAMENVMVGLAAEDLGHLGATLLRSRRVRRREFALQREAKAILRFVGYPLSGNESSRDLSFGHRRLVEVARALACQRGVLLLDEPTAGLSQTEIDSFAELIRAIRAARIAVLLVEHNMDFLMKVSDEVTVLDAGKRIAHGRPEEVQRDPLVLKAYLGEAD